MTQASIIAAGRELGMARLSVAAVAARLGVSAAALYRHVQNRWHLESLVGESLLADLTLDGGPGDGRDVESRLLWFALTLHDFATDRPGLAGYALTLFPRGEAGLRLMETEASALRRCGLTEEAALVVSNAVATVTFSLVAAEERRRDAAAEDADGGFAAELLAATRRFESEPRLGAGRRHAERERRRLRPDAAGGVRPRHRRRARSRTRTGHRPHRGRRPERPARPCRRPTGRPAPPNDSDPAGGLTCPEDSRAP